MPGSAGMGWGRLLFLGLLLPTAVLGWGVEGEPGVRRAVRLDSLRILLHIGPGFAAKKAVQAPGFFQVLSAEDPRFSYGIAARAVRLVQRVPDGHYPSGWTGPVFHRHTVEVTLPDTAALLAGRRYWVRVNASSLMGRNRRAAFILDTDTDADAGAGGRYGLREAYVLSPRALHLIVGPGLDLPRLRRPGSVSVSSPDDAAYADGVRPVRIGRRSYLDFYIPRGWPWKAQPRHELFVELPQALKSGKTYTINLNALPGAPALLDSARWTLRRDDRVDFNLAFKVNQLGYRPAAEKYAYLGMWAGDLNAYDFSPYADVFEVRDAETHQTVFSGTLRLRQEATYRLEGGRQIPDPKEVKGPETVYGHDLSYEDVYEADFSAWRQPGRYYVALPGMGRSFDFAVDEAVYRPAWETAMRGLYHQRCGIELGPPWTPHYRPACHRGTTEMSTASRGVHFLRLPEYATDGRRHDLWGGHHDAGDWNPRAHLEVAEWLLLLYELNPTAFADGQLPIPENANGLPDILDEAWWAFDLWNRLQDEDGGVRAGIESAGDPREGDSAATDGLREFAFAKSAGATYRYAAAAAQMALAFEAGGRPRHALPLLERARRAWDWAETRPRNGRSRDSRARAAALLFRATGTPSFGRAFERASVLAGDPGAELWIYTKRDQVLASFHYARSRGADPVLRRRIVAAFERDFARWQEAARTTAYRYMREPNAPNTWGTGGLPTWLARPALAGALSADAGLRRAVEGWIGHTCDFSLGAHPLNLVFTVGLGRRHVTTAWHYLMLNSPAGPIAGLQGEGAGGRWVAGQRAGNGMEQWPALAAYPPGPWPDLYKYAENASPATNEGIVRNQVLTAFAYGLLLPPLRP